MDKKELYKEKYENAPKEILEVMRYENSIEVLRELWNTYDIPEEKWGNLSFEIGSVLLGITHPKDFVPQLEKELAVSNESARAIAQDVNEKIFSRVKDILIEVHGLGEKDERAEKDVPQTVVQKDPEEGLPETKPEIKTEIPQYNPVQKPSQEAGYNTPPEILEKKLEQSVLTSHKHTIPVSKIIDSSQDTPDKTNALTDPYREPAE